MYYSGINPLTGENVYVAKTSEEKHMQRALLQYRDPKNHRIVCKALHMAHRTDLIGFSPRCLVRPLSKEEINRDRMSSGSYDVGRTNKR
jgi:hypothetical protein